MTGPAKSFVKTKSNAIKQVKEGMNEYESLAKELGKRILEHRRSIYGN